MLQTRIMAPVESNLAGMPEPEPGAAGAPAPLYFRAAAVLRHRMGTDGAGVTTLVAAHGCPLRCRHCLNPQTLKPDTPVTVYTPESLLAAVQCDQVYFLATGGGITFGGGEPLLYADFIRRFRQIAPPDWKICIETSLQAPAADVLKAAEAADRLIVDIKDMNPEIYRRYTGGGSEPMRRNLTAAAGHLGNDHIQVRVPLIPGYNTEADREQSIRTLHEMGLFGIDLFEYIVR